MAKYDIFISYSSKDNLPIEICRQLERRGARCWIAPRDIPKGFPYARSIMEGLRNSDVVLVFISSNSLYSEDVLNEVDNAHGMHKTIIPVFIENVQLNAEFSYYLKRKQWVNCFENFSTCVNELVQTLNIHPIANTSVLQQPPFSIDYFFEKINTPKRQKTSYENFLMPIEDVFQITGRGTVVTGKIESGSVKVGDSVWLRGMGKSVEVLITGIEMFRKLLDAAEIGDECGILLRGVEKKNLKRGMILAKKPVKTVIEFSAAVYLFRKDECKEYCDIKLEPYSSVKIYNRVSDPVAKIIEMNDSNMTNGDYGIIKFRVADDIYLENDDVIVLRNNNITIGVGLVFGL